MSKKSTQPEGTKVEPHQSTQGVTEPAGRTVFVCCSKFSKPFMAQAAQDFRAGKVKAAMQMQLPDGQIITAGPTYETRMSPEMLQMIKSGVLQASNFGKLAKRG